MHTEGQAVKVDTVVTLITEQEKRLLRCSGGQRERARKALQIVGPSCLVNLKGRGVGRESKHEGVALALKDLLNPTSLCYESVLDTKSRGEVSKHRRGQTASKGCWRPRLAARMFGKEKNGKSMEVGKHRSCYGRGIGLVWLEP